MSLYRKPIQPITIAPTIEDKDRLSLMHIQDYLQLQWWMSYDPHKLERYIEAALELEQSLRGKSWPVISMA